jgi:DNA-directed RNA polymerase subunit RPC12/RpoP
MSEFIFSCPACGRQLSGDTGQAGADINCPACHALIVVPNAGVAAAAPPSTGAPPPVAGGNALPVAVHNSGLAMASLICSLSSLIICVGWLPGIICGHLAKARFRRDPSLKGQGLATAGLILGYLILVLEAGTVSVKVWSFSHAVKQGFDHARETLATNDFITLATNVPAADEAGPSAPTTLETNLPPATLPVAAAAAVAWTTNLDEMTVPEHPVSGQLHGVDFTLKRAMFRPGTLRMITENGLALEVLGLAKSPEGQSYEISPADEGAHPRVRITWNEAGVVQTLKFSQGYTMKLTFSPAVDRWLAGKIYVCLPDDAKSCLAGTFNVRVPKPK